MSNVKLTGILKLSPNQAIIEAIRQLNTFLPLEAKTLSEEHLHVTLVNQNLLKPFKASLKNAEFEKCPEPCLENKIHKIVRPEKTSWIVLLKNQSEMIEYVKHVKFSHNLSFEEDRVFHISLANLDGSPFSSVGDVKLSDISKDAV